MLCFCNWLHGHSWCLNYLLPLCIHSVFPLALAGTSAGQGSLPRGISQTTPKESGQLAVLSELSCSFSLTSIIGLGTTKRSLKRCPVFQTYYSLLHDILAFQFSLGNQDQ